MSKKIEHLLECILDELHMIRTHLIPPPPMTPDELELQLTKTFGVGPDDIGNK
jgi:hypothetical protein